MPRGEETVTTSASIDEVWAFHSDFRPEKWDPPTVSTVRVAGDGGVGARYQNTSRVLGHDTDIVYTVVEREARRLLRLHGESDSFTAAAKLATPLLDAGLQKIGHDAAEQRAERVDRRSARPAGEASERR
jgi:hypothetical protein